MVDDFGIKFQSPFDLAHLINHSRKRYKVSIGQENLFCGISLNWNYKGKKVTMSLLKYIPSALIQQNHKAPTKPQHSPHYFTPPKYGKKVQTAPIAHTPLPLMKEDNKYVQQTVGIYNWIARVINSNMLPTVGTIATNWTLLSAQCLRQKIQQLLDYAATHPIPQLVYTASQMHLWAHSDAAYLNESKSRSRAGGYAFLRDKPNIPIHPDAPVPPQNAPIDVLNRVIDAVMSSAQEAETGAGYMNACNLVLIRQSLIEMGHPQGPTPIQFDNQYAVGLFEDNVNPKRSKAMYMRFYWLRDRVRQEQFYLHWKKASKNLADYVTKHHSTKHHVQ